MEGNRRNFWKNPLYEPNGPNGRMVSMAEISRNWTVNSLKPTLGVISFLIPEAWLARDL